MEYVNIDQLVGFFKFQNRLKEVERRNFMPNGRHESSAEHSWSVAMMSWMLTSALEEEFGQKLDQSRMIKMALIHDIVEIEAGDVAAWNTEARKNIAADELKAIENISSHLDSVHASEVEIFWKELEAKETLEAKIVKACDQLCPLIYRLVFSNNYHGTGVTFEKLDSIFIPIISFSETTKNIYSTVRAELLSRDYFDK